MDGHGWQNAATDPYANERSPFTLCREEGWGPTEEFGTGPVLEVMTGLCPHVSVTREAAADVPAGAEVKVRLWHFALINPEPATAHAAIHLAGRKVWSVREPIPSDARMIREVFRAPFEVSEGDEVLFHLRNHGANSWALVELSVATGGADGG